MNLKMKEVIKNIIIGVIFALVIYLIFSIEKFLISSIENEKANRVTVEKVVFDVKCKNFLKIIEQSYDI